MLPFRITIPESTLDDLSRRLAGTRWPAGVTDSGGVEKQDAVTYRVGVIGEAARNVSVDAAEAIDLDWRGITGMRSRLFHGYGEVDVNLLWKTVIDYLPPMITTLERYLAP